MSIGATGPTGFYGKCPAIGDFITRNLGRDFTEPWDGWLQSCLNFSREELGDYWLETYLTSPIWRFALSPGVCGPKAWAGAVMPSVDRVGRNFPMCIACVLPPEAAACRAHDLGSAWFDRVEVELLSALDDEHFEVGAFESRVVALGSVSDVVSLAVPELSAPAVPGALWRMELNGLAVGDDAGQMLHAVLKGAYGAYGMWWTAGSDYVKPSLLVTSGLPPAQAFTAMIASQWEASGWHDSHREPDAVGGVANGVVQDENPMPRL